MEDYFAAAVHLLTAYCNFCLENRKPHFLDEQQFIVVYDQKFKTCLANMHVHR